MLYLSTSIIVLGSILSDCIFFDDMPMFCMNVDKNVHIQLYFQY